jgi:hypothetical protein
VIIHNERLQPRIRESYRNSDSRCRIKSFSSDSQQTTHLMTLFIALREPIRLMTLGQNRGKASEEAETVVREPNDSQDPRTMHRQHGVDLEECLGKS